MMAENIENPKRRKLSLKEKKISMDIGNYNEDQSVHIGEKSTVDDMIVPSVVYKDSTLCVDDDDSKVTDPDCRDLRNKLLKLRRLQSSSFVEPAVYNWPSYKNLLCDNEKETVSSTAVETTTSRDVVSNNSLVTWPKPCLKCLTLKPYPKINILEETIKNMKMQRNMDNFQEPVIVHKESNHDTDAGNFELMDIPVSEEETVSSSPVLLNNKEKYSKDETLAGAKVKLTACPMCQLEFSESLGTIEVDSHLAQCLAAAGDDDVVW